MSFVQTTQHASARCLYLKTQIMMIMIIFTAAAAAAVVSHQGAQTMKLTLSESHTLPTINCHSSFQVTDNNQALTNNQRPPIIFVTNVGYNNNKVNLI